MHCRPGLPAGTLGNKLFSKQPDSFQTVLMYETRSLEQARLPAELDPSAVGGADDRPRLAALTALATLKKQSREAYVVVW
jgi:hypothetical protein